MDVVGCTYVAPTLADWEHAEGRTVLEGINEIIDGKTRVVSIPMPAELMTAYAVMMKCKEIRDFIAANNLNDSENELPTFVKIRDYSSGSYGKTSYYVKMHVNANMFAQYHTYTGNTELANELEETYITATELEKIMADCPNNDEIWSETRVKYNRAGLTKSEYDRVVCTIPEN